MRYLKGFNESFNTEDYYYEISRIDYPTEDDNEPFKEKEYLKIKKLLKGFTIKKQKNEIHVVLKDLDLTLFILNKVQDEWFFLLEKNKKDTFCVCFKCDQLDGLLKCIEDKIINHPSVENLKKGINQNSLLYRWFSLFPEFRAH